MDTLENKENLFKTTRILTEGIVAGKRESVRASEIYKMKTSKELFDKMDQSKSRNAPRSSSRQLNDIYLHDIERSISKGKICLSEHIQTQKDDKGNLSEIGYHTVRRNVNTESPDKSPTADVRKIRFNKDVVPDLWNNEDWHAYHTRLNEVSQKVVGKKGWPGFNAVFMISAIDGDGVEDIKVLSQCMAFSLTLMEKGDIV